MWLSSVVRQQERLLMEYLMEQTARMNSCKVSHVTSLHIAFSCLPPSHSHVPLLLPLGLAAITRTHVCLAQVFAETLTITLCEFLLSFIYDCSERWGKYWHKKTLRYVHMAILRQFINTLHRYLIQTAPNKCCQHKLFFLCTRKRNLTQNIILWFASERGKEILQDILQYHNSQYHIMSYILW